MLNLRLRLPGRDRIPLAACWCAFLLSFGILPTERAAAAAAAATTVLSPLTRCRDIHRLLPAPENEGIPARVRGQVVYADPVDRLWIVRDDESGVLLLRPAAAPPLDLGDLVSVSGITRRHGYGLALQERECQVEGHAPLPPAPPISADQLINVFNDPQWLSLEARVESVRYLYTNTLEIVLAGTRDTRALLPGFPPERSLPVEWIDGLVRLQGSWTSEADNFGSFRFHRLFVPSTNHVDLIAPSVRPVELLEPSPVSTALRFNVHRGESRRIKVRGTVTADPDGSMLFVQDATGGIRIHSRTAPQFQPGDAVEVVGFPALDETTPQIEEAEVIGLGPGRAVEPVEVDPATLGRTARALEATLVRLVAETVAVVKRPRGAEMVVHAANHYFSVHLPRAGDEAVFATIKPASRVEVTGVCLTVPGRSLSVGRLQILLRNPGDIRVLRREPWWTTTRTALVFSSLLGVALVVGARVWRQRRRVELRYRQIFQSATQLIAVHRADGHIVQSNPSWSRLLGMPAAQLAQRRLHDLAATEDLPRLERWWSEVLEGANPGPLTCALRQASGATLRVELRGNLLEERPKETLVETIGTDLTDRWDADRQRRELAAIVEHSNDAIIGTSLDGTITSWNRAAERVFGYHREDVLNRPLSILFPPGMQIDQDRFLTAIREGRVVENLQVERVRKDGQRIRISSTISPLFDDKGNVVGASKIARDVTRVQELEDRLRQAQKMEAVGQLAGGVAHDFNNILSSLILQTELTRETPDLPATVVEELEQIRADAGRAADLTRQLLLFSRRQALLPCILDLNEILRALMKMLRRLIREDIHLELATTPEACWTNADRSMVEQVAINLALNARDAMPQGGRLLIETLRRDLKSTEPLPEPEMSPGRYVGFRFSDSGSGIAPEVLPRIFEPFFTTKEPGRGTGLGLATVFGIVKQHRGWTTVVSRPGLGSVFEIYLPESPPPGKARTPSRRQGDLQGSETILLVEDEPAVRRATRSVLQRNGYRVFEATSGEDALAHFQSGREPLDLLLTDLVMPGTISGQEVARRLLAQSPGTPVIYMSGYSLETAGKEFLLGPRESFIQKPFEVQTLLEMVRHLLDLDPAPPR